MALAQAWTWFFGMLFFGNAYHTLGLNCSMPAPRAHRPGALLQSQWQPPLIESVLGLLLLLISATLFFAIMILP